MNKHHSSSARPDLHTYLDHLEALTFPAGPSTLPGAKPSFENFLRFIREVEQHSAHGKTVSVYKKLHCPYWFRTADEIDDSEIDAAWAELLQYLRKNGVDLFHSSPRVTSRELYRFTTEELFRLEFLDSPVPGMVTCFLYDDFYPDFEYENLLHARYCIATLLSSKKLHCCPGWPTRRFYLITGW